MAFEYFGVLDVAGFMFLFIVFAELDLTLKSSKRDRVLLVDWILTFNDPIT